MKAEPAFPVQSTAQATYGMTLRDYFATAAMQGMISSGSDVWPITIAEKAYKMADAMLRAREEQ